MRVKFSKNFFGPNGARYRKDRWYDVPDVWGEKKLLPRKGVTIDDSPPAPIITSPVKPEGKKSGAIAA